MNILKKNALSWLFYYTLWRIFQDIIFTKYFQETGSSYIYLDLIKAIILAVWEPKIFEFTKEKLKVVFSNIGQQYQMLGMLICMEWNNYKQK